MKVLKKLFKNKLEIVLAEIKYSSPRVHKMNLRGPVLTWEPHKGNKTSSEKCKHSLLCKNLKQ